MVIGICGMGGTGSDAVLYILKECKNINVLYEKEFLLTYFPDGLEDLEYRLMNQKARYYSSDIAIKSFKKFTNAICHNEKSYYNKLTDGHFNELVDEYLNNITQVKYKGNWMYDDYIFDSIFEKIKYALLKRIKPLKNIVQREINFSVSPDNFYDETRKFLKKVYNYHNIKGNFVIDQAFPGNNPVNSMRLFGDDSKAIVIIRDPRDVYLTYKRNKERGYTWFPVDTVEDFITFLKNQYTFDYKNKNILYVQFEDLVYNYEKTAKKIVKFCGLKPEDHVDKFKYFSPKKSLKNTQRFKNNTKYASDIKKIEKEMKDYLYDFSKAKFKEFDEDSY